MKIADAPPSGWYPDPAGWSRLRWWDGTDWTNDFRAPPTPGAIDELLAVAGAVADTSLPSPPRREGLSRTETNEIISEVRNVARSEVDRAADVFTQRAQSATREIQPLITEYTNRIVRVVRFAVVAAVILLVAWFVFQVIFQASVFDWMGDRIDNLSNDDGDNAIARS